MSSHQTSSDIMPVATALKRLLRFSGFSCCRSTEETLYSVAGCWFKVQVEVQNWLRDTNGIQKNLEMFFQKRKNNDVNVTEGAASDHCAAAGVPHLLARVPSLPLHTECEMNVPHVRPSIFSYLSETPPGGRIDKICYPFSVFWACLQGLWPDRCAWNLSGGSWVRGGSPGGISIRFPDTTSRSSGCTPQSLCLHTSGETLFLLLCIRCLVLWATSFYRGWRVCWDGY